MERDVIGFNWPSVQSNAGLFWAWRTFEVLHKRKFIDQL